MKEVVMHRDLSDETRQSVELMALGMARGVSGEGQSLAIAREAWINAFDKAAEKLDNGNEIS